MSFYSEFKAAEEYTAFCQHSNLPGAIDWVLFPLQPLNAQADFFLSLSICAKVSTLVLSESAL
jgi:hypothetical protein